MADRTETVSSGYFRRQAKELMDNLWHVDADRNLATNRSYDFAGALGSRGDGNLVRIVTKYIEPAWEMFESAADIYVGDEIVFGTDSRNIGSYRNERYSYGTYPDMESACAALDEMFAGKTCDVYDHDMADELRRAREADSVPDVESEVEPDGAVAWGDVDGLVKSKAGTVNEFVEARRLFSSELHTVFGHSAEHKGVPMSDTQSIWLSDIADGVGTIADRTSSQGFEPARMPWEVYYLSESGVLTTDEAYQVIATAISTIPERPRLSGVGPKAATWPDKLVDSVEARYIVDHYRDTALDLKSTLVRDDKRHAGRKNVCLFLDDGGGVRKRFANVSAMSVLPGPIEGTSRVLLPENLHLFGYENGSAVRETLGASEVQTQAANAKATYARSRSLASRTPSSKFVENPSADVAVAFSL